MISFARPVLMLLAVLALCVAACGGATTAVPAPTTQQSSGATATEARRSSTSEEIVLRVGVSWLGGSLAPPSRFGPVDLGLGETLFRLGDEYSEHNRSKPIAVEMRKISDQPGFAFFMR